jgi:hypothetical protein
MGITAPGLPTNGTDTSGLGMGGLPGSFPPNPYSNGQGINYTGAVWGSPIPISSGFRSVDGVVGWAGAPYKTDVKTVRLPDTFGMGLDASYTKWIVRRDFVVLLGKRLNPEDAAPRVRRMWADAALVYSNGESIPLTYSNVNQSYLPTGEWVNGVWIPLPGEDGIDNATSRFGLPASGVPYLPPNPVVSAVDFRFYDGNEDQVPDPLVSAALGPLAPAFRGLMYVVIIGYVVGAGESNSIAFQGSEVSGNDNQRVLPMAFPQIKVEIEDADASSSSLHDFQMLDGAPPFVGGDHVIMADYDTRTLALVSPLPANAGGGTLNLFDMDAHVQTATIPITGAGAVIFGLGFNVWDKVNGFIYGAGEQDGLGVVHPVVGIDMHGAVTGFGLNSSANNPENVDNSTITVAKPAIRMPEPHFGCMIYPMVASSVLSVLYAGWKEPALYLMDSNGTPPTFLNPQSLVSSSPHALTNAMALPLLDKGLKGGFSYQDAAVVYSASQPGIPAVPGEVVLLYISIDGTGFPFIRGRVVLYTAADAHNNIVAMVDNNGDVFLQEVVAAGGIAMLTRIKINYQEAADYTVAPGWNGIFPAVGGIVSNRVPSGENYDWEGNGVANSDMSANTLSFSGQLLDTTKLSVTVNGLGGANGFTNIWDSVNTTRFFQGTLQDSAFGRGMRWGKLLTGFSGGVNTLDKYLRDFSHEAGFTDGQISIDPALTDEVPGALILRPYDLETLFNDIGVMYDFAYYNSGGKLTFKRSTNSPTKATGVVTFSGVPNDGDTFTIGSQPYRFKTIPSAPFDVKIGVNSIGATDAKERTAANLLAAIMADLSLGAVDSLGDAFFPGTVKSDYVTAKAVLSSATNGGFTAILLTSLFGGLAGNSITLAQSGVGVGVSGSTLTGGADAADPIKSIDLADFMHVDEQAISDYDSLITTISPLGQGEQAAALNYYALEQDYAPLTQYYIPDNQGGALPTGKTTRSFSIPFVISTSEAYRRVAKASLAGGDNVVTQQFRLTQKSMLLEPADVVTLTLPPFQYVVRLDEATLNGDYSTSFTAANYSFRTDINVNDSDSTSRLPQSVPGLSDCLPVVVDAPILNASSGTHPGKFDLLDGLRAYAAGFGEGTLSVGPVVDGVAGEAVSLFNTSFDVKWGTVSDTLPVAIEPFMMTREDSFTIIAKTLTATDLASASDYTSFVSGQNCLLIGRPGSWEYIYFRDVEVLGVKTFKFTGLIRGQRGTEVFANDHTSADIVLLVASAAASFNAPFKRQTVDTSSLGNIYRYYAQGIPSKRDATKTDVTMTGLSLYPFAPGLLTADLVGGNDIDLAWVRRDRLNTEFVTNPTVMSEATELYDLEILSGSTVVRTVNGLTSPAYTYTSAHQTTDGFTPPLATLKVNVYQVSGDTGRGFKKTETLNVT